MTRAYFKRCLFVGLMSLLMGFVVASCINSLPVHAQGGGLGSTGSGLIPSSRLRGTATNDAAPAGFIGEIISSNLASPGSSVTTATPLDLTSVSLTAGDWDVNGKVCFVPAGTTSLNSIQGWTSATSATLPAADTEGADQFRVGFASAVIGNVTICYNFGPTRVSLAATTTYYLSARASFTVSTMTAFGFIRARRVR